MLAGVLLHVIAATVNVDDATNAASALDIGRTLEEMQDRAVILFSNLSHTQPLTGSRNLNPSRVENLAATGGIKGGAIKNYCRARIDGTDLGDLRVELVEERIVVIEMVGHLSIVAGPEPDVVLRHYIGLGCPSEELCDEESAFHG